MTAVLPGGNGGSLPAWWVVDNTAHTVEFDGFVAVAPTDETLDALATITAPVGFLNTSAQYAFLDMIGEDGESVWTIDADGDLYAHGAAAQGHSAIFMRSVDSPTYFMDLTSGSEGGAPFISANVPDRLAFFVDKAGNVVVGGKLEVAAGDGVGFIGVGPTAAPTDAAVFSAGVFTFWMDTTDGAAKLMIKAKQANGSVVTGSVDLT